MKKINLIELLLLMPFMIALIFYTTFVVSFYLKWFLAPLGFPKIPFISLVALLSLINVLNHDYKDSNKTLYDVIRIMIGKFVTISFMFGMGYIFYLIGI